MVTVADTAYSIAVVRSEETARPPRERLFEDPYASIFAAAGEHAREATERFVALPFFREGIRLRTRFNDDAVREGLRAGLGQVVLMGAGFDARGLRMPEIEAAGARVFEIDFAHQLETKRGLLAAAGVAIPAHVHHVACDFGVPDFDVALETALVEHAFRVGAGAVYVWEGVTPYIGKAAIDRSLAFMARLGGPGSRVVFDVAESVLEPDTVARCTARAGFATCDEIGFDQLWQRHFEGEPHPVAALLRAAIAMV